MYNSAGTLSTGGALAATGLTGNPIWAFLAVFAMIALGMAVLRIVPRSQA